MLWSILIREKKINQETGRDNKNNNSNTFKSGMEAVKNDPIFL